jgi:hypothetical protein
MNDISIFPDKAIKPTDLDVAKELGASYELWQKIYDFVFSKYPDGLAEWNYPGKKYGWSFRIKDKKRAIIYFLPRAGYFKVAFVFGDKALSEILESSISSNIKDELVQAKKYAEGRGVRIDVNDESILADIQQLVEIKLRN